MLNPEAHSKATGSPYQQLFRIGSIAALVAAAAILGEVVILAIFPPPETLHDWFVLLQSTSLLGLLDLWGLEIPMYLAFIPVFLALAMALKKAQPGLILLALTVALLGIGVFLATNNPFAMLALSKRYAAATSAAEKSTLLAAGQALLAHTNQRAVGGFNMALFLVSIAGLLMACNMRRSAAFGSATALVGILAHTLSLADYLRQALTASPIVALIIIVPNALLLIAWYILVGRKFAQLGRPGATNLPPQS
ncbi:MAG: hypothetical protein JW892_06410 [Anaerolineae bacterium]|nr:hypothetical protein [Anaerolineae bacterium]